MTVAGPRSSHAPSRSAARESTMHPPDDLPADESTSKLRLQWVDPPSGRPLFPLDHPYIELVYTPLLGASAILFLRRLALLSRDEAEIDVDAVSIARELGMRSQSDRPLGRNSPFMRTLNRLERHQLAQWLGPHLLGVCRQAPTVSDRYLPALPESARRIHVHFLQA